MQGRNDKVIVKNDFSIGDLTYNINRLGILSTEIIEKIEIISRGSNWTNNEY